MLLQRGDQEFAPLLFSLQTVDQATPRAATPLRNAAESSISTQRRSATPGSIHTDMTPAPPPPIMRLSEDVVMEDPGSAARVGTPGRGGGGALGAPLAPAGPLHQPQQQVAGPSGLGALPFEQQQPAYEDVWVTVYGFSAQDTPLILAEFYKCGEIVNWGTFGQPHANFLHVQYQSKYGAQRALLRNGEQLSGSLIVGVKPLDARHRQAVEAGGPEAAEAVQLSRAKAVPNRPYRIEAAAGQQVPQPARSLIAKVYEYVLGV